MAGELILVIDDNLENARFMVDYLLAPSGYVPIVAANGRQGLEMALAQKPDLIILDFKLPEMSGLQVLQGLREKQCDIPVIFMTAYGSEEDIVTSFRLGVKDYFSRPFEIHEMLATIQRLLDERREREQYTQQQRELQACIKELGTLYGSSLERVLNRIVEHAVSITAAEEGYLLLVDEGTDELYMRSALNVGERFARGFRLRISDSTTGRVVQTARPVRYNYLDEYDRFKVKTGYLVRALLYVPLRAKDRVIGVLGVDNKKASKVFSRADEDLLTSLAEHAVTAIENARLYEQTQHTLIEQVQQLATMQKVAHDLNGILDPNRIASLVLRHAMQRTSAEAGLVGVRAEDEVVWNSGGYFASVVENGTWAPHWKAGAIGQVTESGRPRLVHDAAPEARDSLALPETCSQLTVPILRGEDVTGVIHLESSKPSAFAESSQRFVFALANQAAVAIDNTRLFDIVVGEQRKTRFILNSIGDGVCTVGRDLGILTFNPAAERIVGWQEHEVRGRSGAEVFRDAGVTGPSHLVALIQQVLQSGQPVASKPDVPPILNRDGREVFLSSSVSPLLNREGRLVGVVVAFRDVSAERQLDRLKSDFVSMVSHELRSPLASLSAAIELMLKSSEGQGALRETLDIARDNTQCLIALIENILNVSQIEAGQMAAQQEPLILLPIIRRAVHMVQVQAGRREIAVRAPENVPYVLADQNKLEIVLNNLLSNAINYSSEGSRILVRVGEPDGDEVVVSVIDEGIGISKEHIEKIFDRFFRVDTSDGRKVYGYGLGLYISKHMVELQGGRIWVESQVGHGSCFSFTLPIVQMSQAMQEEPATIAIEG